MRSILLFCFYLSCVLLSSECLDISLQDIKWILASSEESQTNACQRQSLQPLNMDYTNVTWNLAAIQYVVSDVLNFSLAVDLNQYGIDGCCVAGLWCVNSTCFTQSYGDHFVNYGWLVDRPDAIPVYTCYSTGSNSTLQVNNYQLPSGSVTLSVYGSGFGTEDTDLVASVNGYHCRNAELCSCQSCSKNSLCPIGSVCFDYSKKVGNVCLETCAGIGDESCPCDQVCSTVQESDGSSINLCLPKSSALEECVANGRSQLQCSAVSLYQNITSLSITVQVNDNAGSLAESISRKRCSKDADCYDGNICTDDFCIAQQCVYNTTSSKKSASSCNSMLYTIQESYTPYTYHTIPFKDLSEDAAAAAQKIKRYVSPYRLTSLTSQVYSSLPFWFLYFGNKVNQLVVFGSGVVALPPYPSCSLVDCGLYKTSSNILSPFESSEYTSLVIYIYTQKPSSTPLFGISTSALHIYCIGKFKSGAKNSFIVSLYPDHSVRYSYLDVAKGTDYAGLWGARASDSNQYHYELRYHNEQVVNASQNIVENSAVSFCSLYRTACLPQSCVAGGESVSITYNAVKTCYALGDVTLSYTCLWLGGAGGSTEGVYSKGSVECIVPYLEVEEGSVVNVDLIISYTLEGSELTPQAGVTGSKSVFSVVQKSKDEIDRSSLLVRYYNSSTAKPSESCGCNALSPSSNNQCDKQGVCAGDNNQGDCYGTLYGSAYHDACNTCSAGYTGRIPVFTCPYDTNSDLVNILSQTIILLVIICCMTIITSTISYSIRRMLIRRAQQEAMLVENEFAMQILQADGTARPTRRGLSEFELEALGTMAFTRDFWLKHKNVDRSGRRESGADLEGVHLDVEKNGERDTCDCSICLSEVTEGSQVRVLPEPCGHIFHVQCIDEWFKQSSVCPLCKRSMKNLLIGEDEQNGGGSTYQLVQTDERPRFYTPVRMFAFGAVPRGPTDPPFIPPPSTVPQGRVVLTVVNRPARTGGELQDTSENVYNI